MSKDFEQDLDDLLGSITGKPKVKPTPKPNFQKDYFEKKRQESPAPEETDDTFTKETEGGFRAPDPSLLDPESRNHWRNKGRESLFDLEVGGYYFVEGSISGVYDTNKPTNIRLAVEEVIIRPYRVDARYEDIPVVAIAGHINTIRKRQNLEFLDLSLGKRHIFIGKLESYTSVKDPTIERRSLKLMRDTDVGSQVREIEKRVRCVLTNWESVKPGELVTRLNKTISMANRLWNVSQEYYFVPHYSQTELEERSKEAIKVCRKLIKQVA